MATKIAMVAAFAAVAGYGVYASQKEEVTLSDTALANMEALAGGEVIIEAICMESSRTCISYPDGYKIEGKNVYKE